MKTAPALQTELATDLIRVVATVLVILVHVVAPITLEFEALPRWHWMTANIFDAAARPCVPLFFMISGHLLLSKVEPVGVFFRKRVARIALPLAVWSLIYLALKGDLTPAGLKQLITKPAEYHLWFLYALIAVYLFVPALRLLVQNTTHKTLSIITALWLSLAAVGPLLEWGYGIAPVGELDLLLGYTGYTLAGYLLARSEVTSLRLSLAALTAITALGIIIYGTTWASARKGGFDGIFYDYISPWVIAYSAALFVLLKALVGRLKPDTTASQFISKTAALTFGVYLIHAAILQVIFDHGPALFNIFGPYPLRAILATTLATLLMSLAVIWLARKSHWIARLT